MEIKLGELIVNFDSKRKPLSKMVREKMHGPYPYYGAACVFDYIDKYIFDGEYILLGEDGTVLNADGSPILQLTKGKFWPNNHTHVLKNNEKLIDFRYLYYLLKNTKFTEIVTGAVQQKISQGNMNNLVVDYEPDIGVQKQIAAVLSAIDDKIELNNKLNANLEEELRSSFAHDYLASPDFKNWRKVQFGDIVSKFATGLNPRKNFVLGHGDNFYVTIKNMADNQVILDDKCDKIDDEALAKINARSDLRKGDFLFSGIGTIGRVFYIDEDPVNWNISESVFTIRPNGKVSTEFMYLLLLSNELQNYVNLYAQGSAQKGIRMSDFKKFNVALPSDEYMKQLTETWKPLINQTKILYRQNRRLSELRDALLPKLMSGEIDVSNVEVSE